MTLGCKSNLQMKTVRLLSIALLISCISPKWTKEVAPEIFVTRFETSEGIFEIEVQRKWSPKAANRFFQLVKHNHFESAVFYRVIANFVAQFGSSDTISSKGWGRIKVPDEKVILGNEKGTLSFARGGKETRATELYINLADNPRLDTLNYKGVVGFPAFGKVTMGMEVVTAIFSGYEGKSAAKLDLLYNDRVKYFEAFPELDTIRRVFIIQQP